MTLTAKQLGLLAAGGSAALLIGAFIFQALGFAPCSMCLWQRWPHAAAIVIGALVLVLPIRVTFLLGAAAALTTGGIGVYHSGVERDLWQGPTSCSAGGGADTGLGLLPGDIADVTSTVVMCDEVALWILGLSMANWNVIASLVLAAIWVVAARRAA